ncbi:MAG TPA: signal peptidase I [Lachnospiraceae bacterium]|nr:signal peptidase I [Lachnospiraceae bacterium]
MRRKKKSGLDLQLDLPGNDRRRNKMAILYEVLFWVFGSMAAVFLGIMTVNFVGIKTSIIGSSMEPSLHNGEEVLLNKIVYQFSVPERGDVIAFHPNGDENTHLYVKRIVGLPGETIQIKQGSVYIDGEMKVMDTPTEDPGIAAEAIKLSDDEYFVMGDNRDNSEDSRSANIGNVSREMIEGKVWYHMKYEDTRMGRVE